MCALLHMGRRGTTGACAHRRHGVAHSHCFRVRVDMEHAPCDCTERSRRRFAWLGAPGDAPQTREGPMPLGQRGATRARPKGPVPDPDQATRPWRRPPSAAFDGHACQMETGWGVHTIPLRTTPLESLHESSSQRDIGVHVRRAHRSVGCTSSRTLMHSLSKSCPQRLAYPRSWHCRSIPYACRALLARASAA